MKNTFTKYMALYKHEMKQLFTQGGTYIFLTFAWIATSLCAFYMGDFFTRNQADMISLFTFLPWIFLFLMPALAMASWAEEWRRGTAERLLTLPVAPWVHTLAKFAALKTLLFIILAGTLPFVGVLYWLGQPDLGPILSGYFGAWLLGLTMLSVSLMCSQLSLSQAGGFVLGVILLFLMIAGGWGMLTRLLEGILPYPMIDILIQYSLLDRFRNFYEGLVDIRDIWFFLSLILTFLTLTHTLARVRTHGWKKRAWVLPTLLIVLIGSNMAISRTLIQWDATPNKLHTLHPVSQNFLQNLEKEVEITFYFSHQNKNLPAAVQQFARRSTDMLRRMKGMNPEKIRILQATPERNINSEQTALMEGIEEIPLQNGEGYYFGMSFRTEGRQARLPIMTPARERFLEFDIMSMLLEMARTSTPKLGILTELDLGNENLRPRFMMDLLNIYNVTIIPPGEPEFPENFDALLMFMTPYFDKENLYALDQYLVNGGKVLMLLDPFLRTAPSIDFQTPDRNADDWALDHPADLLRKWGVEYNYKEVLADNTLATSVPILGRGLVQYPLWLNIVPPYINPELPLTANITRLQLVESGHFQRKDIAEGLVFEPLLATSEQSQYVLRANMDHSSPEQAPSSVEGHMKERYPAAMLKGHFTSTFQATPAFVTQYYKDFADDPNNVKIPPHISKGKKEGAILMLGDLDFLSDEYALTPVEINGQTFTQPANDNLGFFYNSLQFLLGDDVLLPLRGRASGIRPFIHVQNMLIQSAATYQQLEQKLVAELYDVSRRMNTLKARQQNRQQLEQQIQEEIQAFQLRELDIKNSLRQVRRNVTKEVTQLERILASITMFSSPFFLWCFAILFFARRRKLRKMSI